MAGASAVHGFKGYSASELENLIEVLRGDVRDHDRRMCELCVLMSKVRAVDGTDRALMMRDVVEYVNEQIDGHERLFHGREGDDCGSNRVS